MRVVTAAFMVLVVLVGPAARAPAAPSSTPTQLAWSPDGTRLLVARTGPLLEVRADGGVARELVANGNSWYRTPRWSPDGRRVAVNRSPFGSGPPPAIEVVDATDGRVVATLDGQNPVWSPDGTRLAYTTPGAGGRPLLTVADSDGADIRVLGPGAAPAWRPDGLAIAFERDFTIRTIAVDGSAERRIGEGERPLWSPDGSLLAFFTADATHIARRDATRVRRVPGSASVAWLADGRLVLWRDDGTWAVSVATGRTTPLSQTCAEPSADGRRLAVLLHTGGAEHLYVFGPGDRAPRRLELDYPPCAGLGSRCRVGTDRADRMAGSATRDVLFPGAGDDVVSAGAGDDRVDGAFGADTVRGDGGNDVLAGQPGGDRLFGGPGNDVLIGHGGRDLLDGGDGRDFLYGPEDGAAPDTIRCGDGHDTVTADRNDRVAADCERVARPN